MESLLLWGLVLVAAALMLVVIEIFVPSAGMISVVAGVCAIAGLVCLYRFSLPAGVGGTLALLVLVPIIVSFGVKILPSTPIGKRMLYGDAGAPPRIDPNAMNEFQSLVGEVGDALTDLRPVGIARIQGEKLDVLAEVSYIRAGTKVRVTSVEGTQIKVRPVV